jgi:uncharacterized protein
VSNTLNLLRHKLKTLPLGSVRQWHWMSSAVCLIGLLAFSITGITLNHAAQIPASLKLDRRTGQLPEVHLKVLNEQLSGRESAAQEDKAALPASVQAWLTGELGADTSKPAEWQADEIYLALPRPGGDAWLSIKLPEGDFEYEHTDRGWIAFFNDLHKGRHTGAAWSWFIDLFAIVCLVFCISGFWLLLRYANLRLSTWPLVVLGLVAPWLLVLLFVH